MKYTKVEAKDASRDAFRGIWAAITTPFNSDGSIDEPGLRHNMRYLTDVLHVEGVFCTGAMGEFWSLTNAERRRVVEVVVEEAKGKCGVIAHTGHHCARDTVELTQHAEDVGADFVILMTPYYPSTTEAMVIDWFEFVSSKVNIGIWLFDTPFSGRPALSPATTEKLSRIENVCGAKIARPLDHYLEVKRLCGDKLVLSAPQEPEFLTMMRDHGQVVHQSSAAPYMIQTASSQAMREYTDLGLRGRFDEAAKVSATLDPVRALVKSSVWEPYHKTGILPIAAIKAWSQLLGMAAGPVREPLLQIPDEDLAALREDMTKLGLLNDDLKAAV